MSPKVTLQLTASDLWHTCFGGTKEPWTTANPPSQYNCGYYSNGNYVNNFYNGTGPTDAGANYGVTAYPWEQQTIFRSLITASADTSRSTSTCKRRSNSNSLERDLAYKAST